MPKKRIAIFQKDLGPGGIQKSLVNLLNHIDNKKYEIDLYLWDKKTFFEIKNPEVNIIWMKQKNKVSEFFYKLTPFEIQKFFYHSSIKKHYDIAIDYSSYANYCALEALKINTTKRAIWIHNDVERNLATEKKYKVLWAVFKKKFNKFDEVVAVSEGAKKSFAKKTNIPLERIKVVSNYVDVEEIIKKSKEKIDQKFSEDTINIVALGRLTYQKGFDILIENFKQAVKTNPSLRLYIIGDGPEKEQLIKQTGEFYEYVFFVGEKRNPYPYLAMADAFISTSRFEGQGMAILEAKVLGLPIIIPKHLARTVVGIDPVDDVARAMAKVKRTKHNTDNLVEYNQNVLSGFDEICQAKKRVIFAASTGGHLVELEQLSEMFGRYESMLVTERDEFSESLAKKYDIQTQFLEKDINSNLLGKISINIRNLLCCIKLTRSFRPEIVISTGASSSILMCWAAKIFTRSKVIYIETAANISSSTSSGFLAYAVANLFIVQYKELIKVYPKAVYGGTIFNVDSETSKTKKHILVLLGTQKNPFVRPLNQLEKLELKDDIIVQAGHTKFDSEKMKILPIISQQEYDKLNKEAEIVITHAGVGSIIQALKLGKPTIVIPRRKKYGEHLNNHQQQIANYYADKGYVIKIEEMSELGPAIERARDFKFPKISFDNNRIRKLITEFIDEG